MKMLPSSDPSFPIITFVDKKLNRRQFLKFQLKGALWLGTGMAGLSMPGVLRAGAIPDISVVKGKTGAATRAAVEQLGGMKAFVKPGDKVVIKPNMSFANGVVNATNTKPEVIRELVAMVKEAGASRIRVLDNPLGSPGHCIAEIRDACNAVDEGITHGLNDENFYQATKINDKWYGFNRTSIMKDVLAADCLIAAPTAKSHDMTGVSLSLKGMMGLVYDRWMMHQQGLDGCLNASACPQRSCSRPFSLP